MKNLLDTQFDQTTQQTAQTAMDASSIARSVLLAREALDFGANNLSYDITERLRAARTRALAAPTQERMPTTQSKHSNFNFGQWFNHLSGWLRGGIAASTVAIAFLLTFGTTQSDLNNLPNQTSVLASTQPNNVMDTLPTVPTGHTQMSNTVAITQNNNNRADTSSTLHNTTRNTAPANAPMTTVANAAVSPNTEDEQVDIILREKIPLQAYLNDDFNQYANRQVVRNAGQATEYNNQTISQ